MNSKTRAISEERDVWNDRQVLVTLRLLSTNPSSTSTSRHPEHPKAGAFMLPTALITLKFALSEATEGTATVVFSQSSETARHIPTHSSRKGMSPACGAQA